MKRVFQSSVALAVAMVVALAGVALADTVDGDVVDSTTNEWHAEVGDELDITVNLYLVRKGKNKAAESVTWAAPSRGNQGDSSCSWLDLSNPAPSVITAPSGWATADDGTTAGPSVATITGTVPAAAAGKVCQVHYDGTGTNIGGNGSDRYTAKVVIAPLDLGGSDLPVNSAPVISAFSLTRTDACTVSASVAWSDDDADDSHSVVFDWGYDDADEAPVTTTVDPATSPVSRSHTFPAAGTYTVTATVSDGTDTDEASDSFTTLNSSTGLLEPIKPGGASTFKINSSIPLKLVVTDCGGDVVTDLSPTVSLRKIDTSVDPAATVENVDSVSATNGKQMLWNGEHYIYVLSTKNSQFNANKALDQGTYEVAVSHPSLFAPVKARFDLRK